MQWHAHQVCDCIINANLTSGVGHRIQIYMRCFLLESMSVTTGSVPRMAGWGSGNWRVYCNDLLCKITLEDLIGDPERDIIVGRTQQCPPFLLQPQPQVHPPNKQASLDQYSCAADYRSLSPLPLLWHCYAEFAERSLNYTLQTASFFGLHALTAAMSLSLKLTWKTYAFMILLCGTAVFFLV